MIEPLWLWALVDTAGFRALWSIAQRNTMHSSDFSTLFELLPIGAYRSSAEGRQLRANAALVRRVADLCDKYGRPVADWSTARSILGLRMPG